MDINYCDVFKEASLSNFNHLLESGFITSFKKPSEHQYYSRSFINTFTGIRVYITFHDHGLDSSISAFMDSKKKPDSIDLLLFIPFYYPEFPESKFKILFYPGTSIENRINSFCREISSLFLKKPLSLIIKNEIWFEGFFQYPQDQAQGIGWNPPPKKAF